MFWSFSQAIALELISYCDMLFAGSAVTPTGSCPRGITHQSRYIGHLLTSNQVFFAINCELLVFSWLMATCVVWQMKSHVRQFTLVKPTWFFTPKFIVIISPPPRSTWLPWTSLLATWLEVSPPTPSVALSAGPTPIYFCPLFSWIIIIISCFVGGGRVTTTSTGWPRRTVS